MPYPLVETPPAPVINTTMMVPPLPPAEAKLVQLEKTPNITTLPKLGRLGESIKAPVLLKVGDDISTDDIIPAGARVMPFWSNIRKSANSHSRSLTAAIRGVPGNAART